MNLAIQPDLVAAHHTLGIAMCMLRRLDLDKSSELVFAAMVAMEPEIVFYVNNVIPFPVDRIVERLKGMTDGNE